MGVLGGNAFGLAVTGSQQNVNSARAINGWSREKDSASAMLRQQPFQMFFMVPQSIFFSSCAA
jgi:hypothetical protein